jgi:hypothetical protein
LHLHQRKLYRGRVVREQHTSPGCGIQYFWVGIFSGGNFPNQA